MKKIKCLLVLLVISVFLTGCGKSATDSVKKYLDNYKNHTFLELLFIIYKK